MLELSRLGQEDLLWFQAAEAVRGQGSHTRPAGGVAIWEIRDGQRATSLPLKVLGAVLGLTVAGGVLSVQPLPADLHTLTLVQQESTGTGGTLGDRRTPAGGAGAVAG